MNEDFPDIENLREKHRRNDEQRLDWIERWAKFVASAEDDAVWGDQINTLVNSQIEAVQSLPVDVQRQCLDMERHTERPGDE